MDQIVHANKDRRRRHALGRLPPPKIKSHVRPTVAGKKQKQSDTKTSKKLSDATLSPTATTHSARSTNLQPGIKAFMTPLRNAAEPTAQVVDIPTTDTTKQRNATNLDESDDSELESIDPQTTTLANTMNV
jgi:hypothetical protein